MEYIKRTSESNEKQKDVEFLQNGHIFRFNHDVKYRDNDTQYYTCDEYWFSELPSQQEIEIYELLNDEQALYIFKNINNITKDIKYEDIQEIKYNEFGNILNEFAILATRAKMLNDCSELDNIITIIKNVKSETILKMKNCNTISDICRFKFKPEDIDNLKILLKPYLF